MMFLSIRCPCSASHQSTLESLSKEFSSKGFRFIGVHSNADEEIDLAKDYFKKSGLTFPVIQDDHTQIADTWGAFKTPHAFVLDSEGEILFKGGVDNSHIAKAADKHYLRDALVLLVEGKKPAQKEVRVLGCEIRR
jgi:peroxiredoxin